MNIQIFPKKYQQICKNKKLLAKYKKIKLTKITAKQLSAIPKDTVCFNYAAIDTNGDKSLIKEVFTFFDKSGRIIEKKFFENGVIKRQHNFQYNNNIIEKNISIRLITNNKFLYSENESYKKIYDQNNNGTLLVKKIKYNPYKPNRGYHCTFSKYSLNQKNKTKEIFSADTENTHEHKIKMTITNPKQSENLDINLNDDFLPARIICSKSICGVRELVKAFCERYGLIHPEIKPFTFMYDDLPPNKLGYLAIDKDSASSTICINGDYIKNCNLDNIISLVGHETDHAYRHTLIARLGKDNTKYDQKVIQHLGKLKTKAEIEEANKCRDADLTYTTENPTEYANNYLELKAKDAEIIAINAYKEDKNDKFFRDFWDM